MLTLFVGDNTEHTAKCALAYDPSALLIDYANWKKVLQKPSDEISATGYTSLSDLPKINSDVSVLWELLQIADNIHYVPPEIWSDHTTNFSWCGQQTLTEFYLYQCKLSGKNVFGLEIEKYRTSDYLHLVSQRNTNDPSLWVSGCSISHGEGVNPSERYGTLIGKSLSVPTHHLTQGGSSLEWQADQILRSDIRSCDIVIWGLTNEKRAPLACNSTITLWPDNTIEEVEYRLHETRYYKAITSVFQVINFCRKINCQLILLPLICTEKLQMDLVHQDCYYQLPYQINFLDLGNDNSHPGPKQHEFYADFCLDILNQ
jgi:hypothetical protein